MVILFDTSPTPTQRAMSKRVPHPCRVFGDRVGNLTLAARPAFYLHTPCQLRIQCSTTPPGALFNLNQIQQRRYSCPQLRCVPRNPRSKSELRQAVVLTTSFFLPWRC